MTDDVVPTRPENRPGMLSFALGLIALVGDVLFQPLYVLPFGVAAVVFGILGVRRARRDPGARRWPAWSGLAVGGVVVVVGAAQLALVIAFATSGND